MRQSRILGLIITLTALPLVGTSALADGGPSSACRSLSLDAPLSALGHIDSAHLTFKRFGKEAFRKPAGVRVNLVPTQGMSGPLVLRTARCLAASAEGDHPLAMDGIKLRVEELGPHFALFIDAPNVTSAREILRRLQSR